MRHRRLCWRPHRYAWAIAYDEGRLIGILTGTGRITEIVEEIIRVSGKDTGACLLYDDDPEKLKDRITTIESFAIVGFWE